MEDGNSVRRGWRGYRRGGVRWSLGGGNVYFMDRILVFILMLTMQLKFQKKVLAEILLRFRFRAATQKAIILWESPNIPR